MDISPIRRPPAEPTEHLVPDLSDGAEAGLYLALFELVEEGLIITSDETILEVNSAACHLLERTYPQLAGQPLAELFPSEAAYLAARAALFVDGASRGSLLLGMPGGERRHLRCLAAARVRPGVHALVLSPDNAGIDDIAPRPERQDEVWPRLAAAVAQPVLVIDGNRRVSAANAAAQGRLGDDGRPLAGRDVTSLAVNDSEWRRLPGPRPGWELLIMPGQDAATGPAAKPAAGRLRHVFQHLPLPALLCDSESFRILDANGAAEATYGSDRRTLLRQSLGELTADSSDTPLAEGGRRHHRDADGRTFEVELLVRTLPASAGAAQLLVVHNPITPPTPAQQYAGELFALNADGVMVVDDALRIVAINPALGRLTGFSKQTLLGKPAASLLAEGVDDPFAATSTARNGRWQGELATRRSDGTEALSALQIARIEKAAGKHYLVTLRDLTEREQLKARIEAADMIDRLTGLPGRRALNAPFQQLSGKARRDRRKLALVIIDLDGFHQINAQIGEQRADQVLQQISERLQAAAPAEALVARVGADSFLALIPGMRSADDASALAAELLDVISAPIDAGLAPVSMMASAGVALQPDHGEALADLTAAAEDALATARSGGQPVRVFDPGDRERALARTSLGAAIRRAPDRGELALHWQPRYSLADGRLIGAEALLRWNHPQLGLLDAERFVPAAVRSGSIEQLGRWALARACEQMAAWRDANDCELLVSVNVSAVELQRADFAHDLIEMLKQLALPASALELELTDCATLNHQPAAMNNLYALQEAGVSLRIDRFGSAGAPLTVLRHLPVSGLKIDPEFVRDLTLCDEGPLLIDAVLATAQGLGLDVVAAGVEHADQRDLLAARGCHASQGRLHGLPVSNETFGQLLSAAFGEA